MSYHAVLTLSERNPVAPSTHTEDDGIRNRVVMQNEDKVTSGIITALVKEEKMSLAINTFCFVRRKTSTAKHLPGDGGDGGRSVFIKLPRKAF